MKREIVELMREIENLDNIVIDVIKKLEIGGNGVES